MANRKEKVEAVTDFIFLGSKITEDGDCSHEVKSHLLLGRKAITNLDRMLKSRENQKKKKAETSLCQQTVIFPVVMYGCESWTIKKG